jgi:hypothetical protein
MKRNLKTKRLYWVVAVCFALVLILLIISINSLMSLKIEEKEYFASINVTEKSGGVNLNSSALTFGAMSKTGSSTRSIIFQNKFSFPVVAKISARGNIAKLLIFEKEILVDANKTEKLTFSVQGAKAEDIGYYSGFVKIRIYRAV